MIVESGRIG
jgi:hypothetical protein